MNDRLIAPSHNLQPTMAAIANALNSLGTVGWKPTPLDPDERSTWGVENPILGIRFWTWGDPYGHNKARFTFHGSSLDRAVQNFWGGYYSHDEDKPKTEITVAAAKTPEQMAADLDRRLFPGTLAAHHRACERKRVNDDYSDNTAATVAMVQQLIPTAKLYGRQDNPHNITLSFGDFDLGFQGQVKCFGDRVDWEIDTRGPAQVIIIAKAIQTALDTINTQAKLETKAEEATR